MRKRRNVIVAFLLISVMVLGVGYALLNDPLLIKGSAEVSEQKASGALDTDVMFTKAEKVEGGGADDTATINASDPDIANFNIVSMDSKGDQVVYEFTVQNKGTNGLIADVVVGTITNSHPEYFQVETTWKDAKDSLLPGESTILVITITLKAVPTSTIVATINVPITATSNENAVTNIPA